VEKLSKDVEQKPVAMGQDMNRNLKKFNDFFNLIHFLLGMILLMDADMVKKSG